VIKACVDELALFGGQPLFEETLHVGKPNIGSREKLFERMNDLLDRGWLTNNGPYVRELESRIAELTSTRHCIAMCNGTIALEIAVRALGLTGEVIVPSFTFVATAHCLQWQEITPVFCDVQQDSHLLDPERVENLITPKTSGIIGVHLWGTPCEVERLEEVAARHSLRLFFDASHALGVSRNQTMVGGFGDLEVFSFHATKFVNSFEGGAIVTNDDELAAKIRLMKNFGFSGLDNVIYLGTNGKMSEASAAMGLTSLEGMESFVVANRANYVRYQAWLAELPGCRMLEYDESESNNFQYIVLDIDEQEFGLSRDALMEILHAEKIRARRYFYPGVHRMEPYRSLFPNADLVLPNTKRLVERVMCLPTGVAVGADQIDQICSLLQFSAQAAPQIKKRMSSTVVS